MMRRSRVLTPVVVALTCVAAAVTGSGLSAQVDVLTHRYDNARSGTNARESQLTTAAVQSGAFGKLAERVVDGNIYAQPLVVSGAAIAGRAAPANVAIVATEHNSVYAFDADDVRPVDASASAGVALWHTGPATLGTAVPITEVARAIQDPACADLTPEVGITSTPVVRLERTASPKTGVVFAVVRAMARGRQAQRLVALNLADGRIVGRIDITGAVDGERVTESGSRTAGRIPFDPSIHLNRPALLLDRDRLYVVFGGHCDRAAYHGWVFVFDVSRPTRPRPVAVFNTSTRTTASTARGRSGIWMSGHGPVADARGDVFVATGDGPYDGARNFGNSVLRLALQRGRLEVRDWFTPPDAAELTTFDGDLGSGAPVLLPGSAWLLVGGKDGALRLIDGDRMGHGAVPDVASVQVTPRRLDRVSSPAAPGDVVYWNLHGAPVLWAHGEMVDVFVSGEESPIKQYRLVRRRSGDGETWSFVSDQPVRQTRETAPYPNFPDGRFADRDREPVWMPGGSLTLSRDGERADSAVLWVSMPYDDNANHRTVRGVLRAFAAADGSFRQLWSSEDPGAPRNRLGAFAKFVPPVVANGKVYVATFQDGRQAAALVVYGLRPN